MSVYVCVCVLVASALRFRSSSSSSLSCKSVLIGFSHFATKPEAQTAAVRFHFYVFFFRRFSFGVAWPGVFSVKKRECISQSIRVKLGSRCARAASCSERFLHAHTYTHTLLLNRWVRARRTSRNPQGISSLQLNVLAAAGPVSFYRDCLGLFRQSRNHFIFCRFPSVPNRNAFEWNAILRHRPTSGARMIHTLASVCSWVCMRWLQSHCNRKRWFSIVGLRVDRLMFLG